MKITTKILLSLMLIVAGLVLTRIIVSNTFSVDGIALDSINRQLASLDKDNMILKEKLYMLSSYLSVASNAANMGFVEEKSQLILNNTSALAIKQ